MCIREFDDRKTKDLWIKKSRTTLNAKWEINDRHKRSKKLNQLQDNVNNKKLIAETGQLIQGGRIWGPFQIFWSSVAELRVPLLMSKFCRSRIKLQNCWRQIFRSMFQVQIFANFKIRLRHIWSQSQMIFFEYSCLLVTDFSTLVRENQFCPRTYLIYWRSPASHFVQWFVDDVSHHALACIDCRWYKSVHCIAHMGIVTTLTLGLGIKHHLWLDCESHVTSFYQSELIISEKIDYYTLKFLYKIINNWFLT